MKQRAIVANNLSRLPPEVRQSPAIIKEMTVIFQIIIRGFAREGVDHSHLELAVS